MEVFTLAALAALVIKITGVAKYVRAGDVGNLISQVFVWVVGIGAAFLAASSNAMSKIEINGATLGSLNAASVILFGLALSSAASVIYDFRKAADNTDSAAEPPLVP